MEERHYVRITQRSRKPRWVRYLNTAIDLIAVFIFAAVLLFMYVVL